MPTIEVCVPENVLAGDSFLVEFEGQQISAVCPKGCLPGSILSIDWAPYAQEALPELIEVTVPDGYRPGMEFPVLFEGHEFNVMVPEGCEAGAAVIVERPAPDAAHPTHSSQSDTEPLPAPPLSDGHFAEPGQSAVLQGLVSKPWLNGERARLVAWDAIKGRWKVSVGGGSEETPAILAVKPENLRSR